jgi:hypothetical protein
MSIKFDLYFHYLEGYNGRCSVYLTQQEGLSFRMVAAAAAAAAAP